MTRSLACTLLAALCALFALVAHAQPPAPIPATLDTATRAAVVQEAARQLTEGYVFPDMGKKAARAIKAALAAGRYDAISSPSAFAQRLTADLLAVAHDKHLRVLARGSRPSPGRAPPPRSEGGVVRADRLAGNVGYIEIVRFPPLDVFRPALDRAMAALAKTRALIIDARRHGGGSADAEAYLMGYFLPKGSAPIVADRFIWRNRGTDTFRTERFWTSPTPFSYAGKPVYVLTSSKTFSGGEALAYGMRALHLCKLVGESTGGGAHPGGLVPLGSGFAMFLPEGRGSNPVTGTNWEGVGVKPDIAAPAVDALKVALEQLGQKPLASDIDTLSQKRLFTPRSTEQPGAAAAVRRMVGELESGKPDYALLSDRLARIARAQLPLLHGMFARLGAIKAVSFLEIDPDGNSVYDVTLAHGSVRFAVTLAPDGKTVAADIWPGHRTPGSGAAEAPEPGTAGR